MATTKIVNIEDLENLLIVSSYPEAPNQSKYGGPWGNSETHKHIDCGALNPDAVEPYNATASVAHGGVNFSAVTAGDAGNDIALSFDGSDDIDTVVAAWNDANAGNTASHDGTGTDVLAAAEIQLSGGGVQLQETQALLDADTQKGRDAQLAELRKQRDVRAARADRQICMHDDGDANKVATSAGWSTQRVSLRDVTGSYRTNSDPTHADFLKGTSSLDSFADDMNDFSGWPADPS